MKETSKGLSYRRLSPQMHVMFGWLQVGHVFRPQRDAMPAWAADRPHVVQPNRTNNTLYVAAEHLTLDGEQLDVPGAGVFTHYCDELRLTAPGSTRSVWSLPAWFASRDGRLPLSGHGREDRWSLVDGGLRLRSVGRGQEFVLDMDSYQEAAAWVRSIIARSPVRGVDPG